MPKAVLLGDPRYFQIKAGTNPHTRDAFGRRKRVDRARAIHQWNQMKGTLGSHGVKVFIVPPVEDEPGLVFPANAGFRFGHDFFLSNLNPARAGEREHYRQMLASLGLTVRDFPSSVPFEGEADFIQVKDPSGDPKRTLFLFTYGRIERPRWRARIGFPPYRRITGFRSDRRALEALRSIVGDQEILPLELIDEWHYHGDTALCPFGPREEFLLVYLEALSVDSRAALHHRLGDRLLPLSPEDGRRFAANSFQITTDHYDDRLFVLLTPDGLTGSFYDGIRQRGVIPCPVDVSEFLDKGGGAVKCMLLNLGEL
jgi:N-dimethylarginine dimethylaminohydrolase